MKIDFSSWSRADSEENHLGIEETYSVKEQTAFKQEVDDVWEVIWNMASQLALIKDGAPWFTEQRPWLRDVFAINIVDESFISAKLSLGLEGQISKKQLTPFRADRLLLEFSSLLRDFKQLKEQRALAQSAQEKRVNQIVQQALDKLSAEEELVLEVWFRAKGRGHASKTDAFEGCALPPLSLDYFKLEELQKLFEG